MKLAGRQLKHEVMDDTHVRMVCTNERISSASLSLLLSPPLLT